MNSRQLHRLEHLESVEFRTPGEEAEYAHLLHLDSDMRRAYDLLIANDMHPTWMAGEAIYVGQDVVHNLLDAQRLVSA